MIVVDASVLAPALGDAGSSGRRARARLSDDELAAPDLIDLEVVSVYRGLVRAGRMDVDRATRALADLAALPIERSSHRLLARRCWEVRDNLTPYDAAYVALAELLDAVLVTADIRIGRAPGLGCDVEVLS